MKVNCEIVTTEAQKTVEKMQQCVKENGRSNEILTALNTWINEIGNLLKPLASDEFMAKLQITTIETSSSRVDAKLMVRHGDLGVNLEDLDSSRQPYLTPEATTNGDSLYLDPQCVRVKCGKLLRILQRNIRERKNAESDLQAGNDLLKLVNIQTGD
jgi:hypothetical protein